jgi:hypothetical protein
VFRVQNRILQNTSEAAPSATSRSLLGRAGDAAALRNAFIIAARRRSFPETSMNRYRTPTRDDDPLRQRPRIPRPPYHYIVAPAHRPTHRVRVART